jgi:hypothetical protein
MKEENGRERGEEWLFYFISISIFTVKAQKRDSTDSHVDSRRVRASIERHTERFPCKLQLEISLCAALEMAMHRTF